jgi:hypothetical protein
VECGKSLWPRLNISKPFIWIPILSKFSTVYDKPKSSTCSLHESEPPDPNTLSNLHASLKRELEETGLLALGKRIQNYRANNVTQDRHLENVFSFSSYQTQCQACLDALGENSTSNDNVWGWYKNLCDTMCDRIEVVMKSLVKDLK